MAPSVAESASDAELERAKRAWTRAHGGGSLPSNVEWWALDPAARDRFAGRPARRPSRSLSGVAVVAVMTAPAPCPHGRCSYCPGGLPRGSPQSYTGEEPSALRGAEFHWDAEQIVAHRLEALEATGHPTSKVEVIVMGGTFPARPVAYQREVFRKIYDGLNGVRSESLAEAQHRNETAAHRMVGLTVETRPDWCDERVLPFLLDAGVTRVEIGVESLNPDVLDRVGRAHGVGDVERASRSARDHGLKIGYHMMLGLPGTTPADDLAMFSRLFDEPSFRPDFLKIYPTLVVPGTPLFEEWEAGRYQPYSTETVVPLLAEIKQRIPPWVRIHRIQRDIPARNIAAGVRASNLRELVRTHLEASGGRCRCLRCREAGRRASPPPEAFRLSSLRYPASGGIETFFAFEEPDSDTVAGYLRLRFPSDQTPNGLSAPVIRELKVLGVELPIAARPQGRADYQHRGFGRRLVDAAVEAARDAGYDELYVRSAVGTREYYRRLGFEPAGPHMAKRLFAGRNP